MKGEILNFNNDFISIIKKIYENSFRFSDELNNFHKILETNNLNETEK